MAFTQCVCVNGFLHGKSAEILLREMKTFTMNLRNGMSTHKNWLSLNTNIGKSAKKNNGKDISKEAIKLS
jgi:hypothetical protein